MRISDWSSDVCSSDLHDVYGLIDHFGGDAAFEKQLDALFNGPSTLPDNAPPDISGLVGQYAHGNEPNHHVAYLYPYCGPPAKTQAMVRGSGEHTSELQSLLRISYAVFCLTKKKN